MHFLVKAKRFTDSVKFVVEADDIKGGLTAAKAKANDVFGYATGQPGAPSVAVEPIEEKED